MTDWLAAGLSVFLVGGNRQERWTTGRGCFLLVLVLVLVLVLSLVGRRIRGQVLTDSGKGIWMESNKDTLSFQVKTPWKLVMRV
ncbi:hypothetical protein M419DRAFT_123710 [Trichoderma reesei RUT C-30]|jgi:uncharacterized membrane protein YiaA|uniref:Uncharacterized protein n=1 Tax=Hypocrea jecorina (strain ATCC 56765 / BCRC 32924 / NRRL 11460 / Rut C-30) TaxID=1344414 RepID=A0A024SAN1_HYPJR|nr:hypothetical protein M419DRAFT_123710 [Trichoderma reesei RUT C-30]